MKQKFIIVNADNEMDGWGLVEYDTDDQDRAADIQRVIDKKAGRRMLTFPLSTTFDPETQKINAAGKIVKIPATALNAKKTRKDYGAKVKDKILELAVKALIDEGENPPPNFNLTTDL